MTKREPPGVGGPVYDSWDEAMSDPDLDLSRPFFIDLSQPFSIVPPAPDPPGSDPEEPTDWSGWTAVGYTDER